MSNKTRNIIIISFFSVTVIAIIIIVCLFLGKNKKNKSNNTTTSTNVSEENNINCEIASTNNNIVIEEDENVFFSITLNDNFNEKLDLILNDEIQKKKIFISFIISNTKHIDFIDEWYKDKDKNKIHVSIESNKELTLNSKKDFILLEEEDYNENHNEIIPSIINFDTNDTDYEISTNKIYNMFYKFIYNESEKELVIKCEDENIKFFDKTNKEFKSLNIDKYHYILFKKNNIIKQDNLRCIEINSNKKLYNVYIPVIDDLVLKQSIKESVNLYTVSLLNANYVKIAPLKSNENEIVLLKDSIISSDLIKENDKNILSFNKKRDDITSVLVGNLLNIHIYNISKNILEIDNSIYDLQFIFNTKIILNESKILYFKDYEKYKDKIKSLFETDNIKYDIKIVQFNSINEYNQYNHIFKNLIANKLKNIEDNKLLFIDTGPIVEDVPKDNIFFKEKRIKEIIFKNNELFEGHNYKFKIIIQSEKPSECKFETLRDNTLETYVDAIDLVKKDKSNITLTVTMPTNYIIDKDLKIIIISENASYEYDNNITFSLGYNSILNILKDACNNNISFKSRRNVKNSKLNIIDNEKLTSYNLSNNAKTLHDLENEGK